LYRLRPNEWKHRFYIIFQGPVIFILFSLCTCLAHGVSGEEGQDAGGLLREWFSVITREIFNPNYALFITAPGDMVTYMINKASYINPEHLDYFKIQWFWRALRSFEPEDRAKFLQFVTGTSKVPLQGFASLEGMNGIQKFSIHMDCRGGDRLPAAHTCFNQLDLPQYESYEKLRDSLLMAIRECTEGFGFA
ncbi:HECT-domain protein, partial [Ancylostoma ceylanicum]